MLCRGEDVGSAKREGRDSCRATRERTHNHKWAQQELRSPLANPSGLSWQVNNAAGDQLLVSLFDPFNRAKIAIACP